MFERCNFVKIINHNTYYSTLLKIEQINYQLFISLVSHKSIKVQNKCDFLFFE